MDRVNTHEVAWAPSHAVFLRRVLMSGAITFALLAAGSVTVAIIAGFPIVWIILACFFISLGFAIEDVVRWQGARFDRWKLDKGLLLHEGPDGGAQIHLSQITSVKTTFSGRVMIHLSSGQRVLIRYLPFPEAVAAQINAARGPNAA